MVVYNIYTISITKGVTNITMVTRDKGKGTCQYLNGRFKDIRIIIVYSVPISLWPTLGKENRYFYTRHPNTIGPCNTYSLDMKKSMY